MHLDVWIRERVCTYTPHAQIRPWLKSADLYHKVIPVRLRVLLLGARHRANPKPCSKGNQKFEIAPTPAKKEREEIQCQADFANAGHRV